MLTYLLLILGLVFLIKGADLLVNGASSIAKKFKISDLVIGLTIVAFGTSAPELIVNLFASLNGNTEIAIGNIVGSNIANVLLILGVSSIIYPLAVGKGTVWKEIPFSLLAAILLGVIANDELLEGKGISAITRIDGLVFLAFFIIFIYYTFGVSKSKEGSEEQMKAKEYSHGKALLMVLLGLAGLFLGGKWIVDGAVSIAGRLGVSQSLIGLTIVAIGTSLPELATSAVAAYRKNVEIAVGNIVGSNIFNVFFILGISSVIRPLPFEPTHNLDIGVNLVASILLFITMFSGKRQSLDRWEGACFLFIYAIYMVFIINRG